MELIEWSKKVRQIPTIWEACRKMTDELWAKSRVYDRESAELRNWQARKNGPNGAHAGTPPLRTIYEETGIQFQSDYVNDIANKIKELKLGDQVSVSKDSRKSLLKEFQNAATSTDDAARMHVCARIMQQILYDTTIGNLRAGYTPRQVRDAFGEGDFRKLLDQAIFNIDFKSLVSELEIIEKFISQRDGYLKSSLTLNDAIGSFAITAGNSAQDVCKSAVEKVLPENKQFHPKFMELQAEVLEALGPIASNP
jgi:hypothetical protein